MQEICQSGSEGGGAGKRSPYLYFIAIAKRSQLTFPFVFQRRVPRAAEKQKGKNVSVRFWL